ncbi:outer membrane protein assembly factor BamE [Parasphingopyxis marina]|uniref:Outer membrane protein assembly factor BamE n=1 Tax=Parasphingopyxis marina TaxID=2761622 RepID=A0A842HT07_9SPHN|nr:outer membrane protein assembly factor BamE [Parasphingopyxis marina]
MARNVRLIPMIATLAALMATSVVTSGCARVRYHQGYIGEQLLINSVEPGIDNRASVEATLGRPTFTSQFTQPGETPVWYYVARDTRQLAFANPRPVAQDIIAVRFDPQGNVATVDHIGMEQVAFVNPWGEETPTLGRNRSFFQELFGNIGQVGRSNQGGGTADNPQG